VRVWIDIDNPPQVQYLLPFRRAFAAAGADVVITARDYGSTLALLACAGVEPAVFGRALRRGSARKLFGLALRTRDLLAFHRANGRPDVLLAASRASACAARLMGIPSYIVGDYEYANVSFYRLTRSVILHPDVIDPAIFRRRGMPAGRLVAFRGIKEDITFSGLDIDAVEPHRFQPLPAGTPRVLVRPPSETSHYYSSRSTSMTRAAVERLAETGAGVVLSPREPGQRRFLDGLRWRHDPIVLDRPLPFLALLQSVDALVCSGGTMLREAAYAGVPAYSVFQSAIGGVDLWLERIGRVTILRTADDVRRLAPSCRGPLTRLDANPTLLRDLAVTVLQGGAAQDAPRPAPAAPSRPARCPP
jgi:predicted glycosyltransferase